jgi:hypothetical protein
LGVKRQGREAEHSRPPCEEFKRPWIYTLIPPYGFMARCLVRHRGNFVDKCVPRMAATLVGLTATHSRHILLLKITIF